MVLSGDAINPSLGGFAAAARAADTHENTTADSWVDQLSVGGTQIKKPVFTSDSGS